VHIEYGWMNLHKLISKPDQCRRQSPLHRPPDKSKQGFFFRASAGAHETSCPTQPKPVRKLNRHGGEEIAVTKFRGPVLQSDLCRSNCANPVTVVSFFSLHPRYVIPHSHMSSAQPLLMLICNSTRAGIFPSAGATRGSVRRKLRKQRGAARPRARSHLQHHQDQPRMLPPRKNTSTSFPAASFNKGFVRAYARQVALTRKKR